MRYPTIAAEQVLRLQAELSNGDLADVAEATRWTGAGEDLDLGPVEQAEFSIRSSWEVERNAAADGSLDRFEATASTEILAALANVPLEILDDPGFWRYLTVRHFWWLVEWREQKAFDSGDWARIRVYVDGTRHAECLLTRMYLRARIAEEAGDPGLASLVPRSADLWRSHVLRVRTSYWPTVVGELVRAQDRDRMTVEPLRAFAKRLNRTGSNVVFASYDADEASELLDDLREP